MPPPPPHGTYVNHFPNPKTNVGSNATPRRSASIVAPGAPSTTTTAPSTPAEKQQQQQLTIGMQQTPQR